VSIDAIVFTDGTRLELTGSDDGLAYAAAITDADGQAVDLSIKSHAVDSAPQSPRIKE
jgi:hypothetical protein